MSRRWTPRDVETLLRMDRGGYGRAETCERLRRTDRAVRVKLCQLRGTNDRGSPRSQRWSPEDEATLAVGLADRASYSAISRLVGRSKSAVAGKVWRMNNERW